MHNKYLHKKENDMTNKYFTEKLGFIPNTPLKKIIDVYDAKIEKNSLKSFIPIMNGVFAMAIPTWPKRYQGRNVLFVPNGINKYKLTYGSGMLVPVTFKYNYIPFPIVVGKEDNSVKNTDQPDPNFLDLDFDNPTQQFYIVSVPEDNKSELNAGDIVYLRAGSGGVNGFVANGQILYQIPTITIMGKIKIDKDEK